MVFEGKNICQNRSLNSLSFSEQMKSLAKLVVFIVIAMTCFAAWHFHELEDPADTKADLETESELEDILNCELLQNSKGYNMFFVESLGVLKENSKQPAAFTSRIACAIESAATKNPKLNIFVVIVGKTRLVDSKQIRTLKSFKNIHFVHLDLVKFSKTTPMGKWIESGKLLNSSFVLAHTSDALRILLLWK
jgi:hypothetical protein